MAIYVSSAWEEGKRQHIEREQEKMQQDMAELCVAMRRVHLLMKKIMSKELMEHFCLWFAWLTG